MAIFLTTNIKKGMGLGRTCCLLCDFFHSISPFNCGDSLHCGCLCLVFQSPEHICTAWAQGLWLLGHKELVKEPGRLLTSYKTCNQSFALFSNLFLLSEAPGINSWNFLGIEAWTGLLLVDPPSIPTFLPLLGFPFPKYCGCRLLFSFLCFCRFKFSFFLLMF